MNAKALLDDLKPNQAAMLAEVAGLVAHESPSEDKASLDDLAGMIAARFEAIGGRVDRIASPTQGDHVRVRFEGAKDAEPALVLCHFDTVWPVGTLAGMPFHVEGDRAFGPGIFDMKSSLVLVSAAVEAIGRLGLRPTRPVVALFTSDEEVGSPTSRDLIEREASGKAYALVMEPAMPGGRLKTARKGVGRFLVTIEGQAAHSGVEPEKGVSAVVELAHQILRLNALADLGAGTTINVGIIHGGTAVNVVPDRATAEVDFRVATMDEARRLDAEIRALAPELAGARVVVEGGLNRPPMERSPAIAALFGRAREIGRSLGLELEDGATGGGSDGNFTAALGLPTLDGLGALGGGAHAAHEHILISSLPERAALLAALLLEL